MSDHDVYSYGVVSASTLYTIRDAFPAVEGYAEIVDERYMTGGEATNSSIVLSRLGARVKLDGNWLGDDDAGRRTRSLLDDLGIDTTNLPLHPNHTTVREVIVAAGDTRTIFGTYVRMHEEARWNTPDEEDILQSRVVCLDPFFADVSLRAAKIAFDASIPVVTVDCRHDDPLVAHATAVVISESYLGEHYADSELEDLFREYQRAAPGLVVFTFGGKDSWFGRRDQEISRLESYRVDAIDTAGAGDSFRAGVVYGLLKGWSDEQTVDFSAALAAIVCTRSPGVLDAPGLDEVLEFSERARA